MVECHRGVKCIRHVWDISGGAFDKNYRDFERCLSMGGGDEGRWRLSRGEVPVAIKLNEPN